MSSNDAYNRNEDQSNGRGNTDTIFSSADDVPANRTPPTSAQQAHIVPNEATHLKGGSKQAYFSDEKVLIPQTDKVI